MKSLDPGYLKWAERHLSSAQQKQSYIFIVYKFLLTLDLPVTAPHAELAKRCNVSATAFWRHLHRLRKLEFLGFDSSGSEGITIYWVRQQIEEKAKPRSPNSVKVMGPNGRRYFVQAGKRRAFARRHGIPVRSFEHLVSGKSKQVRSAKGDYWRLAE